MSFTTQPNVSVKKTSTGVCSKLSERKSKHPPDIRYFVGGVRRIVEPCYKQFTENEAIPE